MPVRLVNNADCGKIEIKGTVFHFKGMNAAIKTELLSAIDVGALPKLVIIEGERFAKALGRCVTKVEGFDLPPAQVVAELADFDDLSMLFTAILGHSSVTEDERKNSATSSSGSQTAATPTGGSTSPTLDEAAVAAELDALRDGK